MLTVRAVPGEALATTTTQPRVLHVLFDPVVGGCESLCIDLVAAFAERGHAQDVVFLSSDEGPAKQRLRALGVTLHVCSYRNRATFPIRFAALCREQGFHAVVNYSIGAQFLVALGARLGGAPRVLSCFQNPAPLDASVRRATRLQAQLARPFVSVSVACTAYVAGTLNSGYGLPSRDIRVVHNWCDVDAIERRAAAVVRPERPAGPVLGSIARLDPIKDQATTIRAFARFRQAVPAATLRMVGDGPLRGELVKLAADLGVDDAVEFLGTRLDVPEQLAQMDIFVYATTANEGFGIVLAEAMAAGVPIVATDVGPCSEVLDSGRAGVLVAPADPAALAEAVELLWKDTALRARLVAAGRTRARAHFSREEAAAQFERLCTV